MTRPMTFQARARRWTQLSDVMMVIASLWGLFAQAQAPVVLEQPKSYDAVLGETVSLEVEADGEPPLVYQWFRDGVPIAAATNAVLHVRATQASLSSSFGSYQVEIRNQFGTTLSSAAYLRGFRVPLQLKVFADARPSAGASVTYVAVSPNNLPASYLWSRDGKPLEGARAPELRILRLQPSQIGTYRVLVTNEQGVLGERSANLTVATNYFLYSAPESQIAYTGDTVRFEMRLVGRPTPSFQWQRVTNLVGETNTTLLLTNLAVSNSGYYSVRVRGSPLSMEASFSLIVLPRTPKALPVALAGWNRDVVLENAPRPFAFGFDGVYELHWFEEGLFGSARGLPTGRHLSSRWHENAIFELQPYNGPNALWAASGQQTTATLKEPAAYRRLYFLAASGYGAHDTTDRSGNAGVILRFADGSTTENLVIRSLDWNNDPDRHLAFGGVHRVNLAGIWSSGLFEDGEGYGYGFTESMIDLEALGLADKQLSAITFGYLPGPASIIPSCHALFAVSGELVGAPRAPVVAQEPIDLRVFRGQRAKLTAIAVGTDLQYQWSFEGHPIVGQTNATLEMFQVEAENVGGYSLSISNSAGQVSTRSARLSLFSPAVGLAADIHLDALGSAALISFVSQVEARYVLEQRDTLWEGGWRPVGQWLRGTGGLLRFEIPILPESQSTLFRVAAFR